jgi:hypothetical protein
MAGWLLGIYRFRVSGMYKGKKGIKKVKLSRYTPWRHVGGEEV